MRPELGAVTPILVRGAPWITTLVVFVLFVATASQTHTGDTPAYLQQIQQGQWLARHHMLPRVFGGLALSAATTISPNVNPYTVLSAVDAAAGAAAAGLLHALLRRLVHTAPGVAAAAGLALSGVVWRIATTFELALFPLVPLLAAALLAAHYRGRHRSIGVVVALGALGALAFGCHSLSVGALPAWFVLLALEDRRPRDRALAVLVFTVSLAASTVLLYEGLLLAFSEPNAPVRHAFGELAPFLEPTPDQQRGVQSPWLMRRGFSDALVVPSGMGHTGGWIAGGWLGVLLLGSIARARTLWRGHRGWTLWAITWLLGVVAVASKVESGNYEYYAQPIAAAFVWSGLVFTGWPRVGATVLAIFASVILSFNAPIILARHNGTMADKPKAPIDDERGPGWENGGGQGGPRNPPEGGEEGGPRNGPDGGRRSGPRGPPPPGGPPTPGSLGHHDP
jgi:hypothetical protein